MNEIVKRPSKEEFAKILSKQLEDHLGYIKRICIVRNGECILISVCRYYKQCRIIQPKFKPKNWEI